MHGYRWILEGTFLGGCLFSGRSGRAFGRCVGDLNWVAPEAVNAELGPTFVAADAATWRSWLARHASTQSQVRLAIFHRGSETSSVGYAVAVEQALCFGWVDGHAVARDDESYYLRFTPRQPASTWSAVNRRERAERLIATGQMTPAGQAIGGSGETDRQLGSVPGCRCGAAARGLGRRVRCGSDGSAVLRRVPALVETADPALDRRGRKRPETRAKRVACRKLPVSGTAQHSRTPSAMKSG